MSDWVGKTQQDYEEEKEWREPYSKEEYEFLRDMETPEIKWKVSKYRDRRSGAVNPIKPSRYYKYLANERTDAE